MHAVTIVQCALIAVYLYSIIADDEEGELESGAKMWRGGQNKYVSLTDLLLYRECFRSSMELEQRLNSKHNIPSERSRRLSTEEREAFARDTGKLLMAIAFRLGLVQAISVAR